MTNDRPVLVITGQLAAGKSSLAKALLATFPFGCHVDVDGIREMVTSGFSSPLDPSDETERQFGLALAGAAALAAVYHAAGFAVAIEGGLDPADIDRELAAVGLLEARVGIVLVPPLEVALERNRSRQTKSFDTSILEDAIREIDADLRRLPVPEGWWIIDNGSVSLEATVDHVVRAMARPPG